LNFDFRITGPAVGLNQQSKIDIQNSAYAFTTFPLRKQEVQTRMRLVAPFTRARTGRRFTFQRRRATLWAWLMVFPESGFLPQISHTCAMDCSR
jgi:hypothetical protein